MTETPSDGRKRMILQNLENGNARAAYLAAVGEKVEHPVVLVLDPRDEAAFRLACGMPFQSPKKVQALIARKEAAQQQPQMVGFLRAEDLGVLPAEGRVLPVDPGDFIEVLMQSAAHPPVHSLLTDKLRQQLLALIRAENIPIVAVAWKGVTMFGWDGAPRSGSKPRARRRAAPERGEP